MAADKDDLFMEVGNPGNATNLAGDGYTIGDTAIDLTTTTNWPTETGVIFGMDVVETDVEGNEVRVEGSYCIFTGVVTGPTSIGQVEKMFGDDQNYAAGATTRVYITVSTEHTNRLIRGILEQHKQDGSHGDITADSIEAPIGTFDQVIINGSSNTEGYSPLGAAVNSVVPLGNRSYSVVVAGDTTGLTCKGMRLRLPRTVTAPIQVTSLNGSTQYYSKSSPAGMTFTDDFVVSAWIKVNAYPASNDAGIITRYNGTSGWGLRIGIDGRITLIGYNAGSGNNRYVLSQRAVPIGQWVHVAALLDMSANTAAAATAETAKSWIMFDGLEVGAVAAQNGTNPSALVQAGNLEVGSYNGGTNTFNGKIAQAAVYNTRVLQLTIRNTMHQTLVGNETSLISAYSFNNTVNDLNTSNANNLTANGSAVATNADTPFTNSVVGTSLVAGTTNFGIIMRQTFSTNTTYIIQLPEGETLPTIGGVGAISYSSLHAPYGFPANKNKWRLSCISKTNPSTPSNATYALWAAAGLDINVPAGDWKVGWKTGGMYNTTTTSISAALSPVSMSGLASNAGAAITKLIGRSKSAAAESINSIYVDDDYSLDALTPFSFWSVGATTGAGVDTNQSAFESWAENAYV